MADSEGCTIEINGTKYQVTVSRDQAADEIESAGSRTLRFPCKNGSTLLIRPTTAVLVVWPDDEPVADDVTYGDEY